MSTVAETLGVARSNLAERTAGRPSKRKGRPPLPEEDLLQTIKATVAELPTYGSRRVWAILRRIAEADGSATPNHKRVYRIMRAHGLLLQKHTGAARSADMTDASPSTNQICAIEWLTDNGSCYVARETRGFANEIGLLPLTTPITSPQSNGMAEAFVRTLKRDYVRVNPCPDAETVFARMVPPL